tara:strand:+ start:882 stop:1244 length:363 start_codon:yes stop_codon:yes gene_type:complete
MGYRSTAILAVSKQARPYLMHFLGKEPEAMSMCFGKHSDRTEDFQGEEGSIMFRFDGIKWYDSFPEIAAIEEFMMHMEDQIEGLGEGDEYFRFVRIGEDDGDIERRGYAFDIHPVIDIVY